MKRTIVYLAIVTAVATPVVAEAQFNMPKLPGSSSSSAPAGDLTGQQTRLISVYVDAGNNVKGANAHMATALGLKDTAAKLNATSDAATSGATSDTLKQNDAAISDSTQEIAAAMKNNPTLDANAKVEYAKGLSALAIGVVKYVSMKNAVTDFGKGLGSASPMMLPKLQTGAYIVKSLPTDVTNLGASLNNAVSFAKSHDIKVPSDVNEALGKI